MEAKKASGREAPGGLTSLGLCCLASALLAVVVSMLLLYQRLLGYPPAIITSNLYPFLLFFF